MEKDSPDLLKGRNPHSNGLPFDSNWDFKENPPKKIVKRSNKITKTEKSSIIPNFINSFLTF
jgi:hypothetical protein